MTTPEQREKRNVDNRARYSTDEEYRAKRRAYDKKYHSSDKGKAAKKAYYDANYRASRGGYKSQREKIHSWAERVETDVRKKIGSAKTARERARLLADFRANYWELERMDSTKEKR